jgi:hypothetical protein
LSLPQFVWQKKIFLCPELKKPHCKIAARLKDSGWVRAPTSAKDLLSRF